MPVMPPYLPVWQANAAKSSKNANFLDDISSNVLYDRDQSQCSQHLLNVVNQMFFVLSNKPTTM